MDLLKNKRILLCVTGGIAAYKAAELVRMMAKEGAHVRVAMTKSAQEFITPITFQTLTSQLVLTDIFDQQQETQISHIEAARWPDCILIAPATANTIGKIANGIADDMVSTLLLAARTPIVIAPAMNWAMWQNEMVKTNVEKLKTVPRFSVIEPEQGELACGETGRGKLAKLDWILDAVKYAAGKENSDLVDETVLVTAGPTYEDIDPVRYVANRSSGKMGFAIAREARSRRAKVVLIAGPNNLEEPYDIDVVNVRSADEMKKAVFEYGPTADIIVKSAAVADYAPARTATKKIHKDPGKFQLELKHTVDILKTIGQKKRKNQFLIGFAAETHQVMTQGKDKLKRKKLDMIVVNDVSEEGAGFEVDTNIVKVITKKAIESLPLLDKNEVAKIIFDMAQKMRAEKASKPRRRAPAKRTSKRPTKPRATAKKTTAAKKPVKKEKSE